MTRDGAICRLTARSNMVLPKFCRATSESAYAPYSPLDIARFSTAVFQNEHSLVHTHDSFNCLSGNLYLLESFVLFYHSICKDPILADRSSLPGRGIPLASSP